MARPTAHDPDYISGQELRPEGSGELLELQWVGLSRARRLELPDITRLVLVEVERRLREGSRPVDPGPFVYFRRGKSVIDEI